MTREIDVGLARAFINAEKVIDVFDRREANAQSRCVAIGRELERRREKRAQRQGAFAKSVIDGDFSEAAE